MENVKSKAIVKFSAVRPATFSKLQCNTDLNMPPANWLSNSANTYGLQHGLCHSTGFSSFRMAHMFPECVGEVDVVSSAENIKHLLKLPHSPKSGISMVIHRIENTLLIDDFDIHKYLLRKSDDDWKWLRSFIYEHINSLSEKERTGFIKNKSRDVLLKKNLVSKFLYHSISETTETEKQTCVEATTIKKNIPLLPEPNITENVPDPNINHIHNRNVVWTFEDIRMLIGTDMPIFGEMCISLRLRDMSQPINVLTGIDYWLDNLMCNVPEVVMCYHLDGIVQKYEIIKTEDLPNIENSKFSPKVIRNVAQNILSFLKANATKAGHTYWLFKGKNDDVVKLYDLTTLCTNNDDDKKETNKEQNPFTVPVAMLLYTVARNMKNSTETITAKQAGSIKTLLDNCIQLLSKEKHPQIITSSHYLLSDLYIPAGINPVQPEFVVDDLTESPENNDEEEQYSDNLINSSNVAVKLIQETLEEYNLDDNWKHNSSPPPISGDVDERCSTALKYITKGLDCLQYFTSNEEQLTKEKDERAKEEEKQKIIHEEQNQKMAKPFQPIPLPYEPLQPEPQEINSNIVIPLEWENKSTKIMIDKNLKKNQNQKKKKKLQVLSENVERDKDIRSPRSLLLKGESGVIKSWSTHLKILLFEKACLVYATLSELAYSNDNYGRSLKYMYMALRCQEIVTINISSISSQKSCLLGRVGDCFFQMAKNVEFISSYIEEFHSYTDNDRIILDELKKDIGKLEFDCPVPNNNIEQLMIISCNYYENALKCASKNSRHELLRRLGSVTNELGVKYMHWAQEEYSKFILKQELDEIIELDKPNSIPKQETLYQNLACKSYDCLSKGIRLFEEVNDSINLSFLYCNMGRFMRFRSHIHLPGEVTNNILIQKKFYNEAFAFYNKALGKLESRKHNVELWDLVNWELSTATFTLAKQLQDYNEEQSRSPEEIEMEVVDMLQKSLKLCDVDTIGPRQILYSFRTALIHHRLASYYHHVYRTIHDESRKRTVLQLCRLHYDKSSKTLENLLEPKEFLEVQLERVSLQEYQADFTSSFTQKLRHLQTGLDFLVCSDKILKHLTTLNSVEHHNIEELKNLLFLFEQRLQVILRTLLKICLTKQNSDGKLTVLYKTMYSKILSTAIKGDAFEDLVLRLYNNITEVKNLEKS